MPNMNNEPNHLPKMEAEHQGEKWERLLQINKSFPLSIKTLHFQHFLEYNNVLSSWN